MLASKCSTHLPILKPDGAFMRKTALVLTLRSLGTYKCFGVNEVLARKTPTEMGLAITLKAAWTIEA